MKIKIDFDFLIIGLKSSGLVITKMFKNGNDLIYFLFLKKGRNKIKYFSRFSRLYQSNRTKTKERETKNDSQI